MRKFAHDAARGKGRRELKQETRDEDVKEKKLKLIKAEMHSFSLFTVTAQRPITNVYKYIILSYFRYRAEKKNTGKTRRILNGIQRTTHDLVQVQSIF